MVVGAGRYRQMTRELVKTYAPGVTVDELDGDRNRGTSSSISVTYGHCELLKGEK